MYNVSRKLGGIFTSQTLQSPLRAAGIVTAIACIAIGCVVGASPDFASHFALHNELAIGVGVLSSGFGILLGALFIRHAWKESGEELQKLYRTIKQTGKSPQNFSSAAQNELIDWVMRAPPKQREERMVTISNLSSYWQNGARLQSLYQIVKKICSSTDVQNQLEHWVFKAPNDEEIEKRLETISSIQLNLDMSTSQWTSEKWILTQPNLCLVDFPWPETLTHLTLLCHTESLEGIQWPSKLAELICNGKKVDITAKTRAAAAPAE